jgi:DNA-binding transcriptional MerR regulator
VPALLTIGRFSRLTGLTIDALRHYDELGLLRPASVDAQTGYRRYAEDQVPPARAIARLRALDLSLADIAAILVGDGDAPDRILRRQLADVSARAARLQHIAHGLRMLIDHKEGIVTKEIVSDAIAAPALDPATRRQLATDLYNHVWTLLETTGRTVDQDDEMLHAAHASRYHWGEVGAPANLARGEWQCSRVYAVLGRAEPALHHARRCLAICQEHSIGDWDLAAAWEAMARASRLAGDDAAFVSALEEARMALQAIADPEDRAVIASDIEGLA